MTLRTPSPQLFFLIGAHEPNLPEPNAFLVSSSKGNVPKEMRGLLGGISSLHLLVPLAATHANKVALDCAEDSEAGIVRMYSRGGMTVIANEEKPKQMYFH